MTVFYRVGAARPVPYRVARTSRSPDFQVPPCHSSPQSPRLRTKAPARTAPPSFRHYNTDERVEGKTMKEHLRFAVAYWHTMRGQGADPFGPGCARRPWEDGTDSVDMAIKRVRV